MICQTVRTTSGPSGRYGWRRLKVTPRLWARDGGDATTQVGQRPAQNHTLIERDWRRRKGRLRYFNLPPAGRTKVATGRIYAT